jgi:putative FmdB family regulatory protein
MPLYEYLCDACGHQFEVIQKFSDARVETCPKCGGRVHKMQSAPAIQFKGSGFYITDYAKKDGPSAARTDAGPSDAKETDKTSKTEKTDQSGKADKSDKSGKSEKTEKSEKTGKSEKSSSSSTDSSPSPTSTTPTKST